jgi:hypothetical protein
MVVAVVTQALMIVLIPEQRRVTLVRRDVIREPCFGWSAVVEAVRVNTQRVLPESPLTVLLPLPVVATLCS